MKRLFAALAAIAVFLPLSVSAQTAWKMQDFHARIAVERDGSLAVTETISADFLSAQHGIYRYVPYQGIDDAGKPYRLDLDLESVTMDGREVNVKTSKNGDNIVWKIGDADRTVMGAHAYVLTYRVEGAVRMFEDFDEVYWNVTGEGWEVPLPSVTATVILPVQFEGALPLRSACYTGAYGSSEQDCEDSANGNEITFTSSSEGNPLTIALGFPKGIVTGPSFWQRIARSVRQYGPWLLPFLVLAFMYRQWRKHGSDALSGPIVAEYEAPSGFRPAETRALISQDARASDLTPTIVDLAVRGYLRIEEIEKKGLLRSSKDYKLIRLKDGRNDSALRAYEAKLLDGLFVQGGEAVEISSLKNSFYKRIPEFKDGVMRALMERKMFLSHPAAVRGGWMGAGAGLMILGIFLQAWLWPLLASGAILLAFGWFMPKWSPEGREAARHALGYKEFISKVEKYRAPWMEDQNAFFQALPYALAFGIGAKWAKAFAHLQMQPPSWYQGAHMAAWSPLAFNDALNGWAKDFSGVAASKPSSGSGSGGGGFSGGGFGGGGGGSW